MNIAERYVVIGHPIAHSKSPDIHTAFAEQTKQNLVYERLLAPLDGFVETVKAFIANGGKGANITVPFKLEAYTLATQLTQRAQAAGAVNTFTFNNGTIVGDNTDGIGMVTDIVRHAKISIAGKRILLLGAGGAARGVLLPLIQEAPHSITIANRTEPKAQELIRQFSAYSNLDACSFTSLAGTFDIIINATSASLDNEIPPIDPAVFAPHTFAYDMMYGKEPTVFMRFATRHGATVRDGLGMLVEQAAEAFYLWRGIRPLTEPVLVQLRNQMSR